ncbi:MAG: response regulator [Deltaproteobacteria bacterium]
MHLAKLLVRKGLISVDQMREAIERQRELNCGLCESLSDLGFISESGLVEFLGKQYGVPVMGIDDREIDRDIIRLIPNDTARGKYLIPVELSGSNLTVAMSDPSNILLLDDLGFLTGKNIKPVVASERSIRVKLAEYYSSDEAGSDLPAKENPAQSRSGHLSTVSSMSDEDRRPIDEIINELEQYKDDYIPRNDLVLEEEGLAGPLIEDGFAYRKEDKPISDEMAPGGNDTETDATGNEFDLDYYREEKTAAGLSDYESGWEIEQTGYSSSDEDNDSENGAHGSAPPLKPDSEIEGQSPVAEEAAADFDEPLEDKDAERLIGFDLKSDKGETPLKSDEYHSEFISGEEERDGADFALSPEEVVLSSHAEEADDFTSVEKDREENKHITSHAVFNAFQVEDAAGEADISVSAATLEKGEEISAEERNMQNRAHDFRSSLHRPGTKADSGFRGSGDSVHTEEETGGDTEFNPASPESGVVQETDGVFFTDGEEEPKTAGLDYLNPGNTETENRGRKETDFSSHGENDSQKEIDAAKIDFRHKGHKHNDGSFEKEETVTNSSERIDGEAIEKQSRGSVLIVDHSLTVQKIVSIALKRQGYTVYTAGDGMQALSMLNEVIPDLIFVDVNMPHMDGYQLCKIIKNHGLTKNIPVVMLTGKTRILDKMKWKRAGAMACIAKPFDSGSLVETAVKHIG